jgi:hypothetical protein
VSTTLWSLYPNSDPVPIVQEAWWAWHGKTQLVRIHSPECSVPTTQYQPPVSILTTLYWLPEGHIKLYDDMCWSASYTPSLFYFIIRLPWASQLLFPHVFSHFFLSLAVAPYA